MADHAVDAPADVVEPGVDGQDDRDRRGVTVPAPGRASRAAGRSRDRWPPAARAPPRWRGPTSSGPDGRRPSSRSRSGTDHAAAEVGSSTTRRGSARPPTARAAAGGEQRGDPGMGRLEQRGRRRAGCRRAAVRTCAVHRACSPGSGRPVRRRTWRWSPNGPGTDPPVPAIPSSVAISTSRFGCSSSSSTSPAASAAATGSSVASPSDGPPDHATARCHGSDAGGPQRVLSGRRRHHRDELGAQATRDGAGRPPPGRPPPRRSPDAVVGQSGEVVTRLDDEEVIGRSRRRGHRSGASVGWRTVVAGPGAVGRRARRAAGSRRGTWVGPDQGDRSRWGGCRRTTQLDGVVDPPRRRGRGRRSGRVALVGGLWSVGGAGWGPAARRLTSWASGAAPIVGSTRARSRVGCRSICHETSSMSPSDPRSGHVDEHGAPTGAPAGGLLAGRPRSSATITSGARAATVAAVGAHGRCRRWPSTGPRPASRGSTSASNRLVEQRLDQLESVGGDRVRAGGQEQHDRAPRERAADLVAGGEVARPERSGGGARRRRGRCARRPSGASRSRPRRWPRDRRATGPHRSTCRSGGGPSVASANGCSDRHSACVRVLEPGGSSPTGPTMPITSSGAASSWRTMRSKVTGSMTRSVGRCSTPEPYGPCWSLTAGFAWPAGRPRAPAPSRCAA